MKGKCFKCGQPTSYEWRVCSDGPWRKVCAKCDLDLNKIALKWAFPETWRKKFDAYKRRAAA